VSKEKVTIGQGADGQPAQAADTFTVTLSNGSVIVAGKAAGVLKLRLLRILPEDVQNNMPMQEIATAFCGIRSFDGQPPVLVQSSHFEALMQRFPSDEDPDRFVNEYRKFVDPDTMADIEKALADAIKAGKVGDELTAFVQQRAFELQKKRAQRVRD